MDKNTDDFIRIDTDQYRWVDRDTLQRLVQTGGKKKWVTVENPKKEEITRNVTKKV